MVFFPFQELQNFLMFLDNSFHLIGRKQNKNNEDGLKEFYWLGATMLTTAQTAFGILQWLTGLKWVPLVVAFTKMAALVQDLQSRRKAPGHEWGVVAGRATKWSSSRSLVVVIELLSLTNRALAQGLPSADFPS